MPLIEAAADAASVPGALLALFLLCSACYLAGCRRDNPEDVDLHAELDEAREMVQLLRRVLCTQLQKRPATIRWGTADEWPLCAEARERV